MKGRMGIRTTVTLDADVFEGVRRESRLRGASFRDFERPRASSAEAGRSPAPPYSENQSGLDGASRGSELRRCNLAAGAW